VHLVLASQPQGSGANGLAEPLQIDAERGGEQGYDESPASRPEQHTFDHFGGGQLQGSRELVASECSWVLQPSMWDLLVFQEIL